MYAVRQNRADEDPRARASGSTCCPAGSLCHRITVTGSTPSCSDDTGTPDLPRSPSYPPLFFSSPARCRRLMPHMDPVRLLVSQPQMVLTAVEAGLSSAMDVEGGAHTTQH